MNCLLFKPGFTATIFGRFVTSFFSLLGAVAFLQSATSHAEETRGLILFTNVSVDGRGVFLAQVAAASDGTPLPEKRLMDAPTVGQFLTLSPDRLNACLQTNAPEWAVTNWAGSASVRISRRTRQIAEAELKSLLTSTLQKEFIRTLGELELRFSQAWTPATIPDELFTLRVSELPTAGITPNFIIRFELANERESFGQWQVAVQAKLWREIWVARSPIQRGRLLADAELASERRDLLTLRDAITELPNEGSEWEFNENLMTGAPLTRRSLRARPLVYRGQMVEGVVRDGSMAISLRVEALEDGLRGQMVRVRNPESRRELRGKVQDEQTIILAL